MEPKESRPKTVEVSIMPATRYVGICLPEELRLQTKQASGTGQSFDGRQIVDELRW